MLLDNDITIYNSRLIDSAYIQGVISIQILEIHLPPPDPRAYTYIVRVELLQQEPTIVEFEDINSARYYYTTQVDYYNIMLPQIDTLDTPWIDAPYTILEQEARHRAGCGSSPSQLARERRERSMTQQQQHNILYYIYKYKYILLLCIVLVLSFYIGTLLYTMQGTTTPTTTTTPTAADLLDRVSE